MNNHIRNEKIALIFVISIMVGIVSLYFYINNKNTTVQVEAQVYRSINYKEKSNVIHKNEYNSFVYLNYTIDNNKYDVKYDAEGTLYQGDIINIYVDKDNPNEIISASPPYTFLISAIFSFSLGFSMLFLSDSVMNFVKKIFNRHEKEEKRKWKYISLFLNSLALIIGFFALLLFGIHKSIYYHYYNEKERINQLVTVKKVDKVLVGSWIDKNKIEHLKYLPKDITKYSVGDTINMKVEKNTIDSKKISTIPKGSDIALIFAALLGIVFIFIRNVKKNNKYIKR